MYRRKTHDAAELSAALSRAAKSRKVFRGGRPKGWRKDATQPPPETISVAALDKAVFRAYARTKNLTLRDVLHKLAAILVMGANVPRRPELAPDGWTYRRTATPTAAADTGADGTATR